MKDYIVYARECQIIGRFNTEKEGIDFVDSQTKAWEQQGIKAPHIWLCYNGTESIKKYDNGR